MHASLAVEFEAVVVDTAGEFALVEADSVATFVVVGSLFVHEATDHIGDEEACRTTIGQCKLNACGAVVGVGVVLLEDELGFSHTRHVFEIVDNFDDGSLVVSRIVVGVRQIEFARAYISARGALGYLGFEEDMAGVAWFEVVCVSWVLVSWYRDIVDDGGLEEEGVVE